MSKVTAKHVLLFVPNLIGYFRVMLSLVALCIMSEFPQFWLPSICFYVVSFISDLFDGWAARKFQQTSEFGGLLDMITDRCSTAGLLHVLSFEYSSKIPFARTLFLFLIILDMSSHWCQVR